MDDSLARPLRLRFSKTCIRRGLGLMAASVACLGFAGILATHQIPYLDEGMKRADMFALLSCLLSAYWLFTGFRQAFGQVVLTAAELSLEPESCGFRVEWNQIRDWKLQSRPARRVTDLWLWLRSDAQPRQISSAWLEPADFQTLVAELQRQRDAATRSTTTR